MMMIDVCDDGCDGGGESDADRGGRDVYVGVDERRRVL